MGEMYDYPPTVRIGVSGVMHLARALPERRTQIECPAGSTVADLMRLLTARADADAADILFVDGGGRLNCQVVIMLNNQCLGDDGLRTPLADNDEIVLVPAWMAVPANPAEQGIQASHILLEREAR
jgi:molybdopterin converting factor small subunit